MGKSSVLLKSHCCQLRNKSLCSKKAVLKMASAVCACLVAAVQTGGQKSDMVIWAKAKGQSWLLWRLLFQLPEAPQALTHGPFLIFQANHGQ